MATHGSLLLRVEALEREIRELRHANKDLEFALYYLRERRLKRLEGRKQEKIHQEDLEDLDDE